MREPARYFTNNVAGSLSLLDAMVQAGVKHIVFSSTAAVYGNPHTSPILETFPIQAVNPYGESKVMVETLLGWFDQIHQLTSVCLRYFNASGADPEAALGEEHEPETHLIPLVLRAVQTGKPVTVFGDDYATPDGTCIRDYIHVNDLAQAHILAVEYLLNGGASDQFNVGTGAGSSVLEMIRTVEEVTGKNGSLRGWPAPRRRSAQPGRQQSKTPRPPGLVAAIRRPAHHRRPRLELRQPRGIGQVLSPRGALRISRRVAGAFDDGLEVFADEADHRFGLRHPCRWVQKSTTSCSIDDTGPGIARDFAYDGVLRGIVEQ